MKYRGNYVNKIISYLSIKKICSLTNELFSIYFTVNLTSLVLMGSETFASHTLAWAV